MKTTLALEELVQFAVAFGIYLWFGYAWWLFLVLLLTPDLSMIGYAISPRVGAITYNIGHHKGLALVIGVLGIYFGSVAATIAGIILFAHSAMDRVFGYGLKYPDHFKHTHLGWLGGRPAAEG